ncbi:hypothetical protein RF11_10493 [Thelohanellus kitauei]|uniref:Uncharacterized protein n=1 Tax=Thelohanellus kitauei TaxID=669202 RepID=A0A0C2MIS0_THEKT|nr:hypothetical protein RF11_10493 [Thelohanellus kitauei]
MKRIYMLVRLYRRQGWISSWTQMYEIGYHLQLETGCGYDTFTISNEPEQKLSLKLVIDLNFGDFLPPFTSCELEVSHNMYDQILRIQDIYGHLQMFVKFLRGGKKTIPDAPITPPMLHQGLVRYSGHLPIYFCANIYVSFRLHQSRNHIYLLRIETPVLIGEYLSGNIIITFDIYRYYDGIEGRESHYAMHEMTGLMYECGHSTMDSRLYFVDLEFSNTIKISKIAIMIEDPYSFFNRTVKYVNFNGTYQIDETKPTVLMNNLLIKQVLYSEVDNFLEGKNSVLIGHDSIFVYRCFFFGHV